jgi:hypothetical protein
MQSCGQCEPDVRNVAFFPLLLFLDANWCDAALRARSVVLLWELLVVMATPATKISCFNFYNDFGEKGEFENRL